MTNEKPLQMNNSIDEIKKDLDVPIVDGIEQSVQTQEQQLNDFKNDPENQQKALCLASQIEQLVGKNWFTVSRLQHKAKISEKEAYQKLQICRTFGLAEVKVGDFKDEKGRGRGLPVFKITISKESRKDAIDQIIQYHKEQIRQFEIQKGLLCK